MISPVACRVLYFSLLLGLVSSTLYFDIRATESGERTNALLPDVKTFEVEDSTDEGGCNVTFLTVAFLTGESTREEGGCVEGYVNDRALRSVEELLSRTDQCRAPPAVQV